MSFHDLIARFLSALNNIPLSGCIHSVYLSIRLPKDILVAFQVLAIKHKAAICRFLCGHKLSTPLGKYQGVCLPDCMVRVCLLFSEICRKADLVDMRQRIIFLI